MYWKDESHLHWATSPNIKNLSESANKIIIKSSLDGSAADASLQPAQRHRVARRPKKPSVI